MLPAVVFTGRMDPETQQNKTEPLGEESRVHQWPCYSQRSLATARHLLSLFSLVARLSAAHWLRHSLAPIGPSTVLYETPGLDGLMGWNARWSHLHPRGDNDLSPQAFPFGTSHLTRADVPFTVTLSWRDFSRQWPCPVVGGWDVSITLRAFGAHKT